MDTRLPLLTVDTVVFPGLVLQVPVTDVQNRAVIRDLAEQARGRRRELVCGAITVRDGFELGDRIFRSLHGVGCAATVSEITVDAGDAQAGPIEVTLTGQRRFRIDELHSEGEYLVADVGWLSEDAGADPLGAATVAMSRFRRYADAVSQISEPGLHLGSLPDDPGTLSYLMSAAMVLLTPDRQKLLEAPDTTTRLAQLVGLIDSELAAMSALPSLPATDITWSNLPPN